MKILIPFLIVFVVLIIMAYAKFYIFTKWEKKTVFDGNKLIITAPTGKSIKNLRFRNAKFIVTQNGKSQYIDVTSNLNGAAKVNTSSIFKLPTEVNPFLFKMLKGKSTDYCTKIYSCLADSDCPTGKGKCVKPAFSSSNKCSTCPDLPSEVPENYKTEQDYLYNVCVDDQCVQAYTIPGTCSLCESTLKSKLELLYAFI